MPTTQASVADVAAMEYSAPPLRAGVRCQAVPSQCSMRGPPSEEQQPTVQTSEGPLAPTPVRDARDVPSGLGLGTLTQRCPSQCRTNELIRVSVWDPTAQTSVAETALTPASPLLPVRSRLRLGTF